MLSLTNLLSRSTTFRWNQSIKQSNFYSANIPGKTMVMISDANKYQWTELVLVIGRGQGQLTWSGSEVFISLVQSVQILSIIGGKTLQCRPQLHL